MPLKFDFLTDYILEDERVILRPLALDNFTELLKLAHDNIWEYSPQKVSDEESLRHYLLKAIEGRILKKEYPFIVYDKLTDEFAGSTRLYRIQPINSNIEIGYTWYGSKFHRSGVNKHCKFLLLQFGFEMVKAKRIEFRADRRNKKSIAALKSIRCVREGLLRSQLLLPDGTRRDTMIFSILKKEWETFLKVYISDQLKKIMPFKDDRSS